MCIVQIVLPILILQCNLSSNKTTSECTTILFPFSLNKYSLSEYIFNATSNQFQEMMVYCLLLNSKNCRIFRHKS